MKQKRNGSSAKCSPFKEVEVGALKLCFAEMFRNENKDLQQLFCQVVEATSVAEQTKLLAELKETLQQRQDDTSSFSLITNGLSILFMLCPLRHPLQQTIKSILLNLEEKLDFDNGNFKSHFEQMLLNGKHDGGPFFVNFSIFRKSNIITAFTDNFPRGKSFISSLAPQVMSYFTSSIATVVNSAEMEDKETDGRDDLLVSLKTMVGIKDILLSVSNEPLLTHLAEVLSNNSYSFDCRVSAGLALFGMCFAKEKSAIIQCAAIIQQSKAEYVSSDGREDTKLSEFFAVHKINSNDESTRIILLHAMLCSDVDTLVETVVCTDELTNNGIMYSLPTTTILTHLILPEFITFWNGCQAKAILVFSLKCFRLWCEVFIRAYIKIENSKVMIEKLLNENGYICQVLFPALINVIGHRIDSIRYQALSSIKLLIKIMSLIHDTSIQLFLFNTYLKDNLNSKSKLLLLSCLLEQSDMGVIVSKMDNIYQNLLNCLANSNLIPFVTDNLLAIFNHSKPAEEIINVQNNMLSALLREISSPKSISTDIIISIILPKLIQRHSHIKKFIIDSLMCDSSNYQFTTAVSLYQLITAKQKRSLQTDICWRDFLQVCDVKNSLVATDAKVRIDAISLVCQSRHIKPEDTELVMLYIRHNTAVSCPSARNQMVELIAHFLSSVMKIYCSQQDDIAVDGWPITLIEDFLQQFKRLLLFNLNECIPYSSKLTSLNLLNCMLKVSKQYSDKTEEKKLSISSILKMDIYAVKNLISCLYDSYDDIKNAASDILITLSYQSPDSFNAIINELIMGVHQGINSTKPDDVSSAGYFIRIITAMNTKLSKDYYSVFNVELCDVTSNGTFDLMSVLLSVLKAQVLTTKELLSHNASSFPLYGTLHCINSCLQKISQQLLSNHIHAFQDLISELIKTCCEINTIVVSFISSDTPEGFVGNDSEFINDEIICNEVDNQSKVSQQLIVCSWRSVKEICNIFGTLAVLIQHSYENVKMKFITSSDITQIIDIFRYILFNVKHVGAFEVAAEGFSHVCKTLLLANDIQLSVLPRKWIKDTSDLLCGDKSSDEMCVTRRGAGMPQFIKLACCNEYCKIQLQPYNDRMPSAEKHLHSIINFINAICLAQPKEHAESCLNIFLKELIPSCHEFQSLSSKENEATNKQILRLNILRFIFLDSKLSEQCLSFIEDGIILAVNGFESNLWTIRNSSTLLFSTLVSRLFGISTSRMTTHEFFTKYPQLVGFVMLKLKITSGSSKLNSIFPGLQFRFFPVLTILSRLTPSHCDELNVTKKLEELKSLVKIYLGSSLWKVRTLAAHALVALTSSTENQIFELKSAALKLPVQPEESISTNQIHGTLLYIIEFINEMRKQSLGCDAQSNDVTAMIDIIDHVMKCRWLIDRNHCLVTTEAFSIVVDQLIQLVNSSIFRSSVPCYEKLCHFQWTSLVNFFQSPWCYNAIGLKNCLKTNATILLKQCVKQQHNTDRDDLKVILICLCRHPSPLIMETICDLIVKKELDVNGLPFECKEIVLEKALLDCNSKYTCYNAKLLEAAGLLGIPFPLQLSTKNFSHPNQAWLHLMQYSDTFPLSDRIRVSLLPLVGMIITWSMDVDDQKTIEAVMEFLLNCSAPERDAALRLSVAKLLRTNDLFTVVCDWLHLTKESAVAIVFWRLIIKLLQDPDDDTSLAVTMAINRSNHFQQIFHRQLKINDLVTEVQSTFALHCIVTNIMGLPGMSAKNCYSLLFELTLSTSRSSISPINKTKGSSIFDESRSDANIDYITLARNAHRVIMENWIKSEIIELINGKFKDYLNFSDAEVKKFYEVGLCKNFGDMYAFLLSQNISEEEANNVVIKKLLNRIHFE